MNRGLLLLGVIPALILVTAAEQSKLPDQNATAKKPEIVEKADVQGTKQSRFVCPAPNGIFPDPADCSFYYQCSNDIPFHQPCPAGTLFNPTALACDLAENVDCSGSTTKPTAVPGSTTTPRPATVPGGVECPPTGQALFADPEDCSKYWECWEGIGYHKQCQGTYLYDDVKEWCNWPEQVDCGSRPLSDGSTQKPRPSTTSRPVTIPGGIQCPSDHQALYPDAEDCSKYWECWEGLAYHKQCKGTYLYDAEKEWCNWPHQVDCGDRPLPQPNTQFSNQAVSYVSNSVNTTQRPVTIPDGTVCPPGQKLYPDEEDCSRYWECWNGYAYHQQCQEPFLYDAERLWCNWPDMVHCEGRPLPDGSTQPPRPATISTTPDPSGFICPKPNGFFAHPTEPCSGKFFQCVGGHAYIMYCQKGLVWSADTTNCDWAFNVESCSPKKQARSDRESTAEGIMEMSTTVRPVTIPGGTQCHPTDQQLFPDETDCSKYWECWKGHAYSMQCKTPFLYDDERQWCNWPAQVNCKGRPLPGGGTQVPWTTTTPDPSGFVCPVLNGFFAHPSQPCSGKFFECVNGQAFLMHCQPGLVWNTDTVVCDWTFNVDVCNRKKIKYVKPENGKMLNVAPAMTKKAKKLMKPVLKLGEKLRSPSRTPTSIRSPFVIA